MCVIDYLLVKLITKLTATPEKVEQLVHKISLIEYGIAGYCRRMAGEIDNKFIPPNPQHHSNNQLAQLLWEQYLEERLHARMLAALINDEELKHCYYPVAYVGNERVDGLSNISPFWWLLGGKRAEDFELCDRLAMMSVLENYSQLFYECLAHTLPDCPFRRLADKISIDEIEHSKRLHTQLIELVGTYKASWLLLKWKIKALLIVPEALRLGLAFAEDSNVEVKANGIL